LPASATPAPAKPAKSAGASKQLHCWRLEQSNAIFGECTIYACPEALKIVFKNGKWMNIARAPGWELFVFNPKEKIYSHTPLDKWKANTFHFGLMNAASTKLVRTAHLQRIGGLWAVEMIPTGTAGQRVNERYWVARDLGLPDQISHVLCGNALLPQLHSVPLRVSMNTDAVQNTVDTTSSSQIDLPVTFFDIPTGYKLAAHPEDVMNSGVMDVVKDMTDF
jgi:hypothetical protein